MKNSALLIVWIEFAFCLSVAAQTSIASSFRFALITDMHLKQNDNHNTINLRKAVYDINAQKEIKFVIVAGDVADKGDRASMLLVKQLLDSLSIPYHIIPGNHDTRYCPTGTARFDSVFAQHHFSFTFKNYRFIGFNTGQGNGINSGLVAPDEMAWIRTQLQQAGTQQPVFTITHFPLLTGQVDNTTEIIQTLLPYNIQAVLSGHYHRNAVFNYSGIPGILTRTLQPDYQGKCGYSIIEIGTEIRFFEKNPENPHPILWLTLPLNAKDNKQSSVNSEQFMVNVATIN